VLRGQYREWPQYVQVWHWGPREGHETPPEKAKGTVVNLKKKKKMSSSRDGQWSGLLVCGRPPMERIEKAEIARE
jgi:hypothetical protein